MGDGSGSQNTSCHGQHAKCFLSLHVSLNSLQPSRETDHHLYCQKWTGRQFYGNPIVIYTILFVSHLESVLLERSFRLSGVAQFHSKRVNKSCFAHIFSQEQKQLYSFGPYFFPPFPHLAVFVSPPPLYTSILVGSHWISELHLVAEYCSLLPLSSHHWRCSAH